jgi:branched-chain amino acid transport system ATP-binding protein
VSGQLLKIEQLDAGYGAAQALFGVQLSLAPGERLAIVGHNGWGKTTLARTIAGLVVPTRGRIEVDGRDVVGRPPHQIATAGVALVPQGRLVFPSLTVEENLRISATAAEHRARWRQVYDLFPRLAERSDHRAANLSGGEQQMLAIARALVRRPRLLVLDEPTEGLAPRVIDQLGEALLGQVEAERLTVLLLEQRIGFAEALCDRVVHMEGRGRLAPMAVVDPAGAS